MKQVIGAHGEVTIIKIDALPEGVKTQPLKRDKNGYVIAHSESGHHHVLSGQGRVDVMERTESVPEGMRIIYAALADPHNLIQDAPTPHKGYALDPGLYEFRISREFNPFTEQARRVAD